jgi:hypothetical protein
MQLEGGTRNANRGSVRKPVGKQIGTPRKDVE